jgi:hypothetical protein
MKPDWAYCKVTAQTATNTLPQSKMGSPDTTNGAAGEALSWKGFYNVINGKLETTEKTRHSINPANGKPIQRVI